MWSLPLDSFSRYPFFSDPSTILISALESSPNAIPSFRAQRGLLPLRATCARRISLRFVEGRNRGQLEHHQVYRWHPCSAPWSFSRVCAACSRLFLSRERFLPRLRASESSSSSLSRSRQLRTPFESPRIEHLLKTSRSNLPYGEQKANVIFRLMFASTCLVAAGLSPGFVGGPDGLCREARYLSVVAGL